MARRFSRRSRPTADASSCAAGRSRCSRAISFRSESSSSSSRTSTRRGTGTARPNTRRSSRCASAQRAARSTSSPARRKTGSPLSAFRQRALDPPREHRHLLLRLAITLALRDLDALPIGVERGVLVARLGERLRVELPRGGVVWVELDRACERADCLAPVAGLRVLVADRVAQERAVPARSQHLLEGGKCAARHRLLPTSWSLGGAYFAITRRRLLRNHVAGLAAHAAKRIDHRRRCAVERALDGLVQPAFGTLSIDEVRGEGRFGVIEREHGVLLIGRRRRELEGVDLAVAGELREHDAVLRFETQVLVVLDRKS